MTISPAVGYHLGALSDNGADVMSGVVSSTYTISNIAADHAIVATCAKNTYAISAFAGTGGSITPASTNVEYSASVTFAIIPNSGYTLSGLTDNGTTVTAGENPPGTFSYTISNVSDAHTVQATFFQIAAASVPALGAWGFLAATCIMLSLALKRRG